MPEMRDDTTINGVFAATAAQHAGRPFVVIPANDSRGYLPEGFEITYGDAARRIAELTALWRDAGYGVGHRQQGGREQRRVVEQPAEDWPRH